MKIASDPAGPPAGADDRDAGGRTGVARELLTHGPATATVLADRLGVSATAVRRHLDHLVAAGLVEATERPPYGPAPRRGRGRPARVFSLTDTGRAGFSSGYEDLALAVLDHLERAGGAAAVVEFARARAAELAGQLGQRVTEAGSDADPKVALAAALTDLGFAASVEPAQAAVQLCQHHCPVARVAERYPQLCEAETAALAHVLGSHVQRLATIAHGDGVCTTVIPDTRSERSSA